MSKIELETTAFVELLYRQVLGRPAEVAELNGWASTLDKGVPPGDVLAAFINCEEFRQHHGMPSADTTAGDAATTIFAPPGHYYSPVVARDEAIAHLEHFLSGPIPDQLPDVKIDRVAMAALWDRLAVLMKDLPYAQASRPNGRYQFVNNAYSWGDGSMLAAMLRAFTPRRVIEIGSGWSSACLLDTVELYFKTPCEITFIEPYPVLLRDLIGDGLSHHVVMESKVQAVDVEVFRKLEAGDFLFIDSTHVLKTGSDVWFELFQILPALAPGVIIHIHDMFWPFEYPREWVVDENRSWNELYAVRAFLAGNPDYEILMFNNYFAQYEHARIRASFPDFLRNSGGALWLRKLR